MSDPSSRPSGIEYNGPRGYPRVRVEGLSGRAGKPYHPHPDLVAAANVALACRLPLLLTGEAGCGKTDFAFAVARQLAGRDGHSLYDCRVRSDSRARDLLYHYDAVRRFSDAQLRSAGRELVKVEADHPARYITLQPLGRALADPSGAQNVVLIDEIDKAPRDLPNDLLVPLDEGKFDILEIPADDPLEVGGVRLEQRMGPPAAMPLVIITSNVERQLPEPFLRRCVFYHIDFPARTTLDVILAEHFPKVDGALRVDVLDVFLELREERAGLAKRPATSELLDFVRALSEVFDAGFVRRRIAAFQAARRAAPSSAVTRSLPWRELPGLASLVKLREDLDRLDALSPAG